MKFVQLEGTHPLEKPKWEGSYLFPRQLFKVSTQRGRSGCHWPERGRPWCRQLLSVMLLPHPTCGRGEAAGVGVSLGRPLAVGAGGLWQPRRTLLCELSLWVAWPAGEERSAARPMRSRWWKACCLRRRTARCSSPSSGSTWSTTTSATTRCRRPRTPWPGSPTGTLR